MAPPMTRKIPRSLATTRAKAASRTKTSATKTTPKSTGGKVIPGSSSIKAQASKVVRHLKADYPDAKCSLGHHSAFQLLVATILSAQCTDQRVNLVTRDLFQRWPTAAHFASVPIATLEKAIQSTGFFRNKAKSIRAASQALVEQYDGEVPREMDQLVALAGVGRKTANVILGTAFGIPTGVVVDTHVMRISRRLGLTGHTDPVKIELDLMHIVPKSEWIDFSHRMIHHGRRICVARKPKCTICSMVKYCPRNDVE
jgi:endonuclease-3